MDETTAPQAAATEDALVGLLTGLVDRFVLAVQNREYALAAGLALMGLVMVVRWLFPKLPMKWAPLASAVLASVPTVAILLQRPGVKPVEVITTGVLVWAASSGLWSAGMKPVKEWLAARNAAAQGTTQQEPPSEKPT